MDPEVTDELETTDSADNTGNDATYEQDLDDGATVDGSSCPEVEWLPDEEESDE